MALCGLGTFQLFVFAVCSCGVRVSPPSGAAKRLGSYGADLSVGWAFGLGVPACQIATLPETSARSLVVDVLHERESFARLRVPGWAVLGVAPRSLRLHMGSFGGTLSGWPQSYGADPAERRLCLSVPLLNGQAVLAGRRWWWCDGLGLVGGGAVVGVVGWCGGGVWCGVVWCGGVVVVVLV